MMKIYLIDGCNFVDYPIGGQLSFISQILNVFPENYFKLIGFSTSKNEKIGFWQKKIINNKSYEFFPLYYKNKSSTKKLMPARLKFYMALFNSRNKLFNTTGRLNLFTHAPETVLALNISTPNVKILHFLHGLENPLKLSRYSWAKLFSIPFWKWYLHKLSKTDFIAATADKNSIYQFKARHNITNDIISIPTSYNENIFKPKSNLKSETPTFVFCGRISAVKGWELLINAFTYYLNHFGHAHLIIIGDGEDTFKLINLINDRGISSKVTLTGFLSKEEIVIWLNKAHVFIISSVKEGWPISLIEALGCGLPVVATNVGGVQHLIKENQNGFIINSRDKIELANAMKKAMKLKSPNNVSLDIASFYTQAGLKSKLLSTYPDYFQ